MKLDTFVMERTQCLYENVVEFNLSESGVSPLSIADILPAEPDLTELAKAPLCYPHSTGRQSLREGIAEFCGLSDYRGITVTNGGSEANFVSLWSLVEEHQRVAFMLPNYLQGFGLGNAWADKVDSFSLELASANGSQCWRLDVDSLNAAVTADTGVIVVTNPNNPTGYVLDDSEMEAVVAAAARVGAWLVVDEIYRGAEPSGNMTQSFAGRYDKLVVTGGLSKAFGLPGLRIGWVAAEPDLIERISPYHDYLTLTPSYVADFLADRVMQEPKRSEVLERTRSIIRRNLPEVECWIATHEDLFDYAPPMAGAICTLRCKPPVDDVALFESLLHEQLVLVTPGPHFGVNGFIRIGFGYDLDRTLSGLSQIDKELSKIRASL